MRLYTLALFASLSLLTACSGAGITYDRASFSLGVDRDVDRWSAYRLPKGAKACLATDDFAPLESRRVLNEAREVFFPFVSQLYVVAEPIPLDKLQDRCVGEFGLYFTLLNFRADVENTPYRVVDLQSLTYSLLLVELGTGKVVEKLTFKSLKPIWQISASTLEQRLESTLDDAAEALIGG